MAATQGKIVVHRGRLETAVVERGIRAITVHQLHRQTIISIRSSSSNVVRHRLSVNTETKDILQKHTYDYINRSFIVVFTSVR